MDFLRWRPGSLDAALGDMGAASVDNGGAEPSLGSMEPPGPDLVQEMVGGLLMDRIPVEEHPWFGKQELTEEAFLQAMREATQTEPAEVPVTAPTGDFQEVDPHHGQQQTSLDDIIEQAVPQFGGAPEEQEDPWGS